MRQQYSLRSDQSERIEQYELEADMSTRTLTIAVTGATSGIGLRDAERLAADGHRVLPICRDARRGEAAVRRINTTATVPARLVLADMADPASIDEAVGRVLGELDHLDVLITNAAVFDQTIRKPHTPPLGTNCSSPPPISARFSSPQGSARCSQPGPHRGCSPWPARVL